MVNQVRFYLLFFLFIFISGCAHVISKDLRAKTDPSLTFGEVFKNPNTYKGKMVIWGGEIIQSIPQKDGATLIEVLQWPLGWRGQPKTTVAFQGKFLVLVEVKTNDELIHYIREKKPGDTVFLKVYRKGNFTDVKVTLGERPRRM